MNHHFILHVWTRDLTIPWMVHIQGKDFNVMNVVVKVPVHTRNDGHTPCANWYLEGECSQYFLTKDGKYLVIED